MSKSSDLHARYYFQVKAVVTSGKPDAPSKFNWEAYGSDFSYYDVYTESPEWFVRDNGFRPAVPLDRERRAELKALGFEFKRDGTVLYKGQTAEEYVGHSI